MSRSLSFIIPGRIGGKGRPRGFIRGGKVAMYTPGKTRSDEGIVRHFAAQAMKKGRVPRLTGALELEIVILRCWPQSWPKKRRETTDYVTGKPDCDNIAKLIADAMNGIAYADDSQISVLSITRRYADAPESVWIAVTEIGA